MTACVQAALTIEQIVGIARSYKGALIHRDGLVHLCQLAQAAPDGSAVEIGVYKGSSLIAIALARAGRGPVYGVDDWSHPEPPDLAERAKAALKGAGVDAQLLEMPSAEAARLLPGPLAFVHIDANHTLDFVRADIGLWAPKIMSGGVITFHDYGRQRADIQVKQAVDEWQAHCRAKGRGWENLGEVLTTIGFRKL
jgi:predicted O-methyltransferase YrrM